jgi:hypothetical protein
MYKLDFIPESSLSYRILNVATRNVQWINELFRLQSLQKFIIRYFIGYFADNHQKKDSKFSESKMA